MFEEFLLGLATGFIGFPVFMRYFWPPLLVKLNIFFKRQLETEQEKKKTRRRKPQNE